jgi:hypothetical protein
LRGLSPCRDVICRSIRNHFAVESPATDDEVHDASLQLVLLGEMIE